MINYDPDWKHTFVKASTKPNMSGFDDAAPPPTNNAEITSNPVFEESEVRLLKCRRCYAKFGT